MALHSCYIMRFDALSSISFPSALLPSLRALPLASSPLRASLKLASALSVVPSVNRLKANSLSKLARSMSVSAAASPAVSASPLADPGAYTREALVGIEAVRLASKLCLVVQTQLRDTEKYSKDDASPVTVADYGAQALVAFVLRRAYPGEAVSLVAEEDSGDLRGEGGKEMRQRITALVNSILALDASSSSAPAPPPTLTEDEVLDLIDMGTSEGGGEGRHWVLDPIDGTRGFVGMRQYAVCLGLLEAGKVVAGVLGCPNLPAGAVGDDTGGASAAGRSGEDGVGVLFAAVAGRGAYSAPLSGTSLPSHRISVGAYPPLGDGHPSASQVRFMESYESRHSSHTLAAAVAERLGITQPSLRMDSQVKYGALSRGDAAAFMRFPPATYREKIWDHAPGVIIVQEAGGVVTDARGAPLDFSRGRYLALNTGIVAGPPAVHASIIKAVGEILEKGNHDVGL